jgi:hypothetical protein
MSECGGGGKRRSHHLKLGAILVPAWTADLENHKTQVGNDRVVVSGAP